MDRILDVSKGKLAQGWVLIKVHMKETLIIAPDSNEKGGPRVDYADVISIASDIKDLSVGDIVLDFKTSEGFVWQGEQYALVPRMNIKFAVERSNFNFDGVLGRKTKRSLAS